MGLSRLIFLGIVRYCKTEYSHLLLVVSLQMSHTYVDNILHFNVPQNAIPSIH